MRAVHDDVAVNATKMAERPAPAKKLPLGLVLFAFFLLNKSMGKLHGSGVSGDEKNGLIMLNGTSFIIYTTKSNSLR